MQSTYRTTSELSCDFVPNLTDSVSDPDIIRELFNNKEVVNKYYNLFYEKVISQISGDKIEETTTEFYPNLFNLYRISPDTGTSVSIKSNDRKNISEKMRMIAIINSCYFEAGMWTKADEFFDSLIKSNGGIEKPLEILSDIVNHNLSNEHILEGILHILYNYSFEEINPYGITISLACTVNHSPVIQDLLIACFEKWESVESIDILENLKLDETWLIKYRNDVVAYLKKKEKTA